MAGQSEMENGIIIEKERLQKGGLPTKESGIIPIKLPENAYVGGRK